LGGGPSLDERLLRVARTACHGPRAESAVARFSLLGEHGRIWLVLAAGGWARDPPRRAAWLRATETILATYAVNTLVKLAVRRRRPELPGLPALIETPTQLSFPSAHASTSFAGARLLTCLGLPAAPLYALAAGMSLSRLYLGVHYPSDVLVGAMFGDRLGALSGLTRAHRLDL